MTESELHDSPVAVIMNYYTGLEYMRASLESLSRQDFPFTLYGIDNASELSPAALLDEFSAMFRIRYVRLSKHVPLYEARNRAVDFVEEPLIAFLDVDDIWMPNKLKSQVRHLAEGGFALTFTGFRTMSKSSRVSRTLLPANYKCPVTAKDLARRYSVAMSSVLVSKRALQEAGGFDANYEIIGDFDLVLKLAQSRNVCFLKEDLVIIRLHDQSTGHRSRNLQLQELDTWKSSSSPFFSDFESILRHVNQEISVISYVASSGVDLQQFFRSLRASGTFARRLSVVRTFLRRIFAV